MLGTAATIEAVLEALDQIPGAPLVVDPVMVAESGAVLLEPDARSVLAERLLPLASVVTPNLGEARVLAGMGEGAEREELARAVHALGPGAVIVTGGHTADGADLYFDGQSFEWIEGERHGAGAAHGSGCTHSGALAAHLAHGYPLPEAARAARAIASEAVGAGLREIGAGAGPVDALGVADRAREVRESLEALRQEALGAGGRSDRQ